ncbi:MAG: porin [Fibrobacterota bacterium]
MKLFSVLLGLSVIVLGTSTLFAKENEVQGNLTDKQNVSQLEARLTDLEETKNSVDKLKKINFSGYVQAQFRYAPDTAGLTDSDYGNRYDVGTFQGGSFPDATRSLFDIRRARVKISYASDLSKMVLQFDGKPTGASIKDAYLQFTEPFLKSISLKGGHFNRPFGFEISYSSSKRESPERSRLFQTIFAGERDLGLSLEYSPSGDLPKVARLFNFKGGVFAGNGLNKEYDDVRDFMGRLGISVPVANQNLSVDGGISGYAGAVRSLNDTLFTVEDGEWVSTEGNNRKEIDRQYLGYDLQLTYGNVPIFGGVTLRGEYVHGRQPAGAESTASLKKGAPSGNPLYIRNFSGYYAMGILDIAPINSKLVAKYDVYLPNNEINQSDKGIADMTYTTIGGGLVYQLDENIRFWAYYDRIRNEAVNASPFSADVNDNVFTFRIQYKY